MASAFKNFFITFILCLLVFGFLGFKYGLDFLNSFKVTEESEPSDIVEESQIESSEDVSLPDESVPVEESNIKNPEGKVFTAVLITVDDDNRPINMVFIDSNEKTEKFVYCTIPVSTKVPNEIGVYGTVQDLFAGMTKDEILQCVSAMTGIDTQYCMIFNRSSMVEIAGEIPGSYVKLQAGQSIPVVPEGNETDVYYIENKDSRGVLLSADFHGKTNIEWLLEYAPEGYSLNEYNTIYSSIASSLIRQFFENEDATNDDGALSAILQACDTNLTIDQARNYADAIFAYDDFEKVEMSYPTSRENAIKDIREADGSYQ